MMNSISLSTNDRDHDSAISILIPADGNKDSISRIRKYAEYTDHHGLLWFRPNLKAYRDHLRSEGLAESSIKAHLSSVRARYRELLRDRDLFFGLIALPPGHGYRPADIKAAVDEIVVRIENAINPDAARTRDHTKQDQSDRERVWLTADELRTYIDQPFQAHGDCALAWRDSALLALLATTGLREFEAVALRVDDLYHTIDGTDCAWVEVGKGDKSRAVPYGDLRIGLERVEYWLAWIPGIQGDQPVFWSFWKNGKSLRGRLTTRAVGVILRQYGVERGGEFVAVRPHDLRRTYARLQMLAGMPIEALRQNMGHTSIEMTKRYIGDLDTGDRAGRSIW